MTKNEFIESLAIALELTFKLSHADTKLFAEELVAFMPDSFSFDEEPNPQDQLNEIHSALLENCVSTDDDPTEVMIYDECPEISGKKLIH